MKVCEGKKNTKR